ncbi:hypothetical protein BU14_0716s0001 [Porphyra umbilicalis]|uniref:Uncharacterized protein n=1 Tax=Porphyra umbilicalis TaxID=2786 RepID=A0A1X6NPT9_PORUM|nr:hypothetical protein BU14_0716s0001 [Porphyra umbilicalis]|eukprot:OSX70585.1 hypothetical protein BU14_0716s0001 [Porphyra umbilicalis]
MHAPGVVYGADRAPCAPGSAWAIRLAGIPVALIRDPTKSYDPSILAPVIRGPEEEDYPRWWADTVTKVTAMATPPPFPHLLYMPIPGPYLRLLPIFAASTHANSEGRARRRGYLISWNHQKFWRMSMSARGQFFASVPSCVWAMEILMGFTTGGTLVAFYARDEMVRACRDPCSIVMAISAAEYLVMACNRWYEEARDGRFWLI